MEKRRAPHDEPTQVELEVWRNKALKLIDNKRTMVLATSLDNASWAAPVYYLYTDASFYFYSSVNALHTRQALSDTTSAVAIYADGDRMDQIEGLQMTGDITPVQQRIEKLSVATRYLIKFPIAKTLLGESAEAIKLDGDTKLYRFAPDKVYYMDNRAGFGRRLEIKL